MYHIDIIMTEYFLGGIIALCKQIQGDLLLRCRLPQLDGGRLGHVSLQCFLYK